MMLLAALKVDSEDAEERRSDVSAAKAHLTSAGWFVQENSIQLHGGIGVTDEQDVGLYFKRLRVLQGSPPAAWASMPALGPASTSSFTALTSSKFANAFAVRIRTSGWPCSSPWARY